MKMPYAAAILCIAAIAGALPVLHAFPFTLPALLNIPSPTESRSFGQSTASVGDLDGDGVGDLATLANNADLSASMIHVYSGSTGSALRVIDSAVFASGTCRGIVGLGDTNGDGSLELALLYLQGDTSTIVVLDAAAETVLRTEQGLGDSNAIAVEGLAEDFDGDTVPEYAVYASDDSGKYLEIRSGATGADLWSWVGPLDAYQSLPRPVVLPGASSIVWGSPTSRLEGEPGLGALLVFDAQTGELRRRLPSPLIGQDMQYGTRLAPIHDQNGDGVSDLAVLADNVVQNSSLLARLLVVSGSDGSLLREVSPPDTYMWVTLKTPISSVDFDRDGVNDLMMFSRRGFYGALCIYRGSNLEHMAMLPVYSSMSNNVSCTSWEDSAGPQTNGVVISVPNGSPPHLLCWPHFGAGGFARAPQPYPDTQYLPIATPGDPDGLAFDLQLQNTGLVPLSFERLVIEPHSAIFQADAELDLSPLASGASRALAFRFRPPEQGDYSTTATLTTSIGVSHKSLFAQACRKQVQSSAEVYFVDSETHGFYPTNATILAAHPSGGRRIVTRSTRLGAFGSGSNVRMYTALVVEDFDHLLAAGWLEEDGTSHIFRIHRSTGVRSVAYSDGKPYYDLARMADGTLAAIGLGGIYRIDLDQGLTTPISTEDVGSGPPLWGASCIISRSDGALLVLTSGDPPEPTEEECRLLLIDPATGDRQEITAFPPPIGSDRGAYLAELPNGDLALSFPLGPLYRFTPDGLLTELSGPSRGKGPGGEDFGDIVLGPRSLYAVELGLGALLEVDWDSGDRRVIDSEAHPGIGVRPYRDSARLAVDESIGPKGATWGLY